MNFTDEQNKAINITNGIICLSAGPGCGKTTVLINKYIYILEKLIKEKNISIELAIKSILAVTFTNKATEEIKIRLKNILKTKFDITAEKINKILNLAKIYTIDSFASNFIKENINYTDIKISNDFKIINSNFTRDLFLEIGYKILDNDEKYINILETLNLSKSPSQILESAFTLILNLLSRLITPEKFYEISFNAYNSQNSDKKVLCLAEFFKILYKKFNDSLEEKNTLIFANLLTYSYKIIKNYPKILSDYIKKENLEYILVDEYQDVNNAEDLFLREISNFIKNSKNLDMENYFLVGDTGQSIYGFRNANYQLMLEYKSVEKSNYFLCLSQNFRSTQTIINFINQYFSFENNNIYQKLLPMREETGEKIEIFLASSFMEDAEYIAKKIKYLIFQKHYDIKDIKILFRSKTKIPIYAKALEKLSIPYKVNDPIMFTRSIEIKIFLSIMKFLLNPMDDEATFLIVNKIFNFSENEIIIIKNLDDIYPDIASLLNKNEFFASKKYKYLPLFKNISFLDKINFLQFIVENKNNLKDLDLDLSFKFFENLDKKIKNFISFSKDIFKISSKNTILETFNKILEREELKKFINLHSLNINFIKDFQIIIKLYEKEDLFGNIFGFLNFFKEMEKDDFRSLEKDQIEEDKIELLTIHKSKGLEFKVVFLAGITDTKNKQNIFHFSDRYGLVVKYNEKKEKLKDGSINFYKKFLEENIETEHLLEEERIFYVGVTRSKDLLFISFVKQKDTYPKLSNKILEIKDNSYEIKSGFMNFIKFSNENSSIAELKIEKKNLSHTDFFRKNIKNSMKTYIENNEYNIFTQKEKIFFSVAELELFRKCPFKYFLEKRKKINILYNENYDNNDNENITFGNIIHEFLFENFYKKYDKNLYKNIFIKKFKLKNLNFNEKYENIINNFINWLNKQDFNNILFVEKNFAWKVKDSIIRGTIDRIDKFSDNEISIIDYKTSLNSKNFNEYSLSMNIYLYATFEIFKLNVKNIKLLYPLINEEIILKKIPKDELIFLINDYINNIKNEKFNKINNQKCLICKYQNFCKNNFN